MQDDKNIKPEDYKHHQDKFNESFHKLQGNVDDIMNNVKEAAAKTSEGEIEKVTVYDNLIEKTKVYDFLMTTALINRDDETYVHYVDPKNDEDMCKSANTTIKEQSFFAEQAVNEIRKHAYENKSDESLPEKIEKIDTLLAKRTELLDDHQLMSDIRELEIKGEKGIITEEEEKKLDELEGLENNKEQSNKPNNDPGEGPSKDPVEESSKDRTEEGPSDGPNKGPAKEQNKGLVEEFADTSTEPVDYFGGDD